MSKCKIQDHDLDNAIRKGRAHYECPKCGEDISVMWFLYQQALDKDSKFKEKE